MKTFICSISVNRMTILKNELYKIISQKTFLLTVLILFALNIAAALMQGGEAPDSAYRDISAQLNGKTRQEQSEIISGLLLSSEEPVIAEIADEMKQVWNYSSHLDDIQAQAEQINKTSIFGGKNSFAGKSAAKTASVYSAMPHRELPYAVTAAVRPALGNVTSDICILLTAALAVINLVCAEKESGAFTLLRTLRSGRASLILRKLAAVFLVCCASAVIYCGSGLLVYQLQFGFVDMSMPIQSIGGFLDCTLQCSLGGFLWIFFLAKLGGCFAASAVIFAAAVITRNSAQLYGICGGFFAAESILYISIDRLSAFAPLKWFNIISLTRTDVLISEYQNVNLFGEPVSLAAASTVLGISVAAAGISASLLAFTRQKNMTYSAFRPVPIRRKNRLSVSLAGHEAWKILCAEKGGALLIVMLLVCGGVWYSWRPYPGQSDAYFRQYVEEHGGAVTPQTELFVEQETARFDELQRKFEETGSVAAAAELRARDGFEIFLDRYEYALENGSVIIYDTGYNELFSLNVTAQQLFLMFLFMSLIMAPVYSSDSRTMPLIFSTKYGRRRDFLIRASICALIAAFIFAASHLPILLRICSEFGLPEMNSAVQCIFSLREFPFGLPIAGYILLRYGFILTGALAAVLIMLAVSRKIPNRGSCTALLLAAFSMPWAIAWIICSFSF